MAITNKNGKYTLSCDECVAIIMTGDVDLEMHAGAGKHICHKCKPKVKKQFSKKAWRAA